MEANLESEKIELIQWLTTLEDPAVIKKLMDFRKTEVFDWWKTISEAERESVEQGLADAEKGNLRPHSEARKVYGKWL